MTIKDKKVSAIKIGISACVIGHKVRFDSGHKLNKFVAQELNQYMQFIPICPEVAIGLPVPRPTIRLISDNERIALVETKDRSKDYTLAMQNFAVQKVAELKLQSLCGYIVCAKSPTCGMERVKVYHHDHAQKNGVGVYTQELTKQMPWLPIEEDGRLNDPILRENFIARVYALHDFYQAMGEEPTAGKIVAFHSRYKLTLMAHSQSGYKQLGKLVAKVASHPICDFYQVYREQLMMTLTQRASRKGNANVLMHIQGYFKKWLSTQERQELRMVIEQYRQGLLPLFAPLTLFRHYLTLYPDEYLQSQSYLEPHPLDLRLRNAL